MGRARRRRGDVADGARGRTGGARDGAGLGAHGRRAGRPDRGVPAAAQSRTLAVATSVAQALAAQEAGADAVVAKGSEAGGWVGEEGAFILLQRLVATLALPVYVQGGIGRHTVVAAYVGGAAGAVLDAQLLLTRESPLAARRAYRGGGHGRLGDRAARRSAWPRDQGLRPSRQRARQCALRCRRPRRLGRRLACRRPRRDRRRGNGRRTPAARSGRGAGGRPRGPLRNRGGVLAALRSAIADATASLAGSDNPLGPDGPLAQSHGTRYPIVQGPMTRVSDTAEFAAAVSEAGALPFLALALMREPEADALLQAHARAQRWPALGRRRARLRPAGAAGRAAGGRAPASAPVRADRRRAPGPGQGARGRRDRHLPARAVAGAAEAVSRAGRAAVRVRGS